MLFQLAQHLMKKMSHFTYMPKLKEVCKWIQNHRMHFFEIKIIINICFGNRSDEADEEEEVLLGDGETLDNEPVSN